MNHPPPLQSDYAPILHLIIIAIVGGSIGGVIAVVLGSGVLR